LLDGCSGGGWFLLAFFVEAFVFAALFVEVQLDAVIEVGFLKHFSQIAGAQVGG